MAARHDPYPNAETRKKIQTTKLMNALQAHALGTRKSPMEASQIKATEILLRKTMPDLKAVDHSGETAVQVTQIITGVPRDGDKT